MLKVVNKRNLSSELGFRTYYIGRPNALGNPFLLEDESQRGAVVEAYRVYLWECIKLNDKQHPNTRAIAERFNVKLASSWVSLASEVIVSELHDLAEKSLVEDIALVCWCSPKACHGDVIVRACAWLIPF